MKILIVSEFFPPFNNVASGRPYSWAQYLAGNHDVTVVTVKKNEFDGGLDYEKDVSAFKLIEVKRKFKKSMTFINRILWVLSSYFILRNNKYDVIISTSNPWQTHLLAYLLKDRKTKWVADYRDLWTTNFHSNFNENSLKNKVHSLLENTIISRCDLITTVSVPLVNSLKLLFPNTLVEVIYNGYEDILTPVERDNKKITIVHTGTIYTGKRDPSPLFAAVNELIKEGKVNVDSIQVKFYGKNLGDLSDIIKKCDASGFACIYGSVSREMSLKEQNNADLLLLLEWDNINTKGVLTGKLFEYMSAGTPILSVGTAEDHCASELIMASQTGVVCGLSVTKIKKVILDIKNENHTYSPNYDIVGKYSRSNQSCELDKLLYVIS